MNILSPHCGLAAETTSGGERYEVELLRRIAEKHDVTVILTRDAAGKAHYAPAWRTHELRTRLPLTWWLAPRLLTEAMRDLPRPDLLRVHSLKYIGPSALYARRVFWPGVPLVAHHHHLDGRWNPIERYVSDRMDRVVVGSEFAKRQMAEAGFRVDHVRVVPYGVDERFQPVDRSGREGVLVLFLGGLKPRKNVELLLRIWPEVAAACPKAVLMIAGDGPLRAKLERQAAGMERVVFAGYIAEKDKPRVYQNADVFVFPSHLEGFGFPVLEAMASGLPVLHSGAGSLPELAYFDGADADQWAMRLTALCRGDVEGRVAIGRLNAANARSYTWDRCVTDTLAVYEEVVR